MRKSVWALVAAVVVVAASTVVAGAATIQTTFGEGTQRVGRDIAAGTYRSRGGDGCYWARLRSFSGNLSAILANTNASGSTIVTIKRTDKGFESSGCATWTSNLRRITKSMTRFGQGEFIVRTDIAPGTYRSRGGEGCYWARLRSFTGELNSIIANTNASGATIVTISRSDRGFESSGCATWTRF
jgi:hypothetical protein